MALGVPRGEMLRRMTSEELTEYLIFYGLEPFGCEVNFMGHAITASTVANVNRGKNQKAYKAEDFMPDFEKEDQDQEQMIRIAAQFAAAGGGELTQDGGE